MVRLRVRFRLRVRVRVSVRLRFRVRVRVKKSNVYEFHEMLLCEIHMSFSAKIRWYL